jgi:hypothetical protein
MICPKCKLEIDVPSNSFGKKIECAWCGATYLVQRRKNSETQDRHDGNEIEPNRKKSQPPKSQKDRVCSFCGEAFQRDVGKCEHCGEADPAGSASFPSNPADKTNNVDDNTTKRPPRRLSAMAATAVVLATIAAIAFAAGLICEVVARRASADAAENFNAADAANARASGNLRIANDRFTRLDDALVAIRNAQYHDGLADDYAAKGRASAARANDAQTWAKVALFTLIVAITGLTGLGAVSACNWIMSKYRLGFSKQ